MKIAFCAAGFTTDCKIWFALSLFKTKWPQGAKIILINSHGQAIRNAIHEMFAEALKIGAEWIVYASVDVGWKPDDIVKLISHDKDIIGGWSNGRMPPFVCHVADGVNETRDGFRIVKNPQERHGIEKVCAVGQELTVYRSSIFGKIKEPWFYGNDMMTASGRIMTEDYYFIKKATEVGIEVWVDWDVQLVHGLDGLVTKGGKLVAYGEGI